MTLISWSGILLHEAALLVCTRPSLEGKAREGIGKNSRQWENLREVWVGPESGSNVAGLSDDWRVWRGNLLGFLKLEVTG